MCACQVDVHNNLGDLWRAQGQVGRHAAQQCYSVALRIDNSYAPAWRGLGDMFRENNEHQQAVTCYQVLTYLAHDTSAGLLFEVLRLMHAGMSAQCAHFDVMLIEEHE